LPTRDCFVKSVACDPLFSFRVVSARQFGSPCCQIRHSLGRGQCAEAWSAGRRRREASTPVDPPSVAPKIGVAPWAATSRTGPGGPPGWRAPPPWRDPDGAASQPIHSRSRQSKATANCAQPSLLHKHVGDVGRCQGEARGRCRTTPTRAWVPAFKWCGGVPYEELADDRKCALIRASSISPATHPLTFSVTCLGPP